MVPQNISLQDHYRGDTFKGVAFAVSKNGQALDLTDCIIKCQFIRNKGPLQQIITLDDYIQYNEPEKGRFQINPFIIDWPEAMYFFDIEFTFPSGIIQTYIKGSITVYNDITKN